MNGLAAVLAAAIGLAVSVGPAMIAQIDPAVADLNLFGVCILGTLISMSACARR